MIFFCDRSARSTAPFVLLSLILTCLYSSPVRSTEGNGDIDIPASRSSRRQPEGSLAEDPAAGEDLRIVRRLSLLSLEEQASLYLGRSASANVAATQARRVKRLLRDPALTELKRFDNNWLVGLRSRSSTQPPLFTTVREFVQCKVMIVRNLHFQGTTPSRVSVAEEYGRIQRAREQHRSTRLFAGRSVVFAASYQKLRGSGQLVFGRSVTQRQLRRQASRFSFVQPGGPGQSLSSARSILRNQFSSASPVTFFFEGHGRESAIKLGGGLDAGDLAGLVALARASAPPIVISASCQGHGYGRQVLEQLRKVHPGRALPVLVVPEEYGQSFTLEVFHDTFKSTALGLGMEDATVGRLMESSAMAISVYVPDGNNRPMQIL